MKTTVPKFAVLIACVAISTLLAADVSGKWVGTMPSDNSVGNPTATLYLRIRKHADTILGTIAYQDESRQVAIEKPELKGDQLTFEVHDNPKRIVRFRFTVSEAMLDGEATSGDRVAKTNLRRQ